MRIFIFLSLLFFSQHTWSQDIKQLEQRSQSGDDEANVELAYIYAKGFDDIKIDIEKSIDYMTKAAENNHGWAEFVLGVSYFDGKYFSTPFEKNTQKGLELLNRAIEQDILPAYYALGIEYYFGNNVPKDAYRAKDLLHYAAQKGHEASANFLNKRRTTFETKYEKRIKEAWEKLDSNNPEEALDGVKTLLLNGYIIDDFLPQIQKIADNGNSQALNLLGSYYYDKEDQDVDKAIYWFEKAAEAGNPESVTNLYKIFAGGYGQIHNDEKASYWCLKAAEQGDVEAQYNIASRYAMGRGIEKDAEKSLYWYQRAADNGHEKAQKRLSCMKD